MKHVRGVVFFGILGGVLALLLVGLWPGQPVRAQDGNTGRYKSVEVQTVQYVWDLIDQATGKEICQVILDREGIPTHQDALGVCSEKIIPLTPTPGGSGVGSKPTPPPFNINQFFAKTIWRFNIKREFTRIVKMPLPEMVLNITVPVAPTDKPYVTLSAFEPVKEYSILSIQGKINQNEFFCEGNQCNIPIRQTTQISFRSYSSFGDRSQEISATIQLVVRSDGYSLALTSLIPFTMFQDMCAEDWQTPVYQAPKWAEFPQLPDGLYTNKSLYFLASRLLYTGIVDAKDCPGQGFLGEASPNGCGMERAKDALVSWQNQYNPVIWSNARKLGVPPKIIKTLIEKESQYWPGNSRLFTQEYGLAQINQFGADVALRWNNDLFKQACNGVVANCGAQYGSLPSWQQDMVRGNLMNLINSECPGCVNGVDLTMANSSVAVIGSVLKANCSQAGYIIKENFGRAAYEDMWKFTLLSYHAGYQCLYDVAERTFRAGMPLTWDNVSSQQNCPGAVEYVNDFWSNLLSLDQYISPPPVALKAASQPTFAPTRTPVPTAVPVFSKNVIRVFVYLDVAGKEYPNDIELISGVPVQVRVPDGSIYLKTVTDGQVTFDMSSHPIGTEVTISLPGFYRSYIARLTEQGEIMVPFRLSQPVLPPSLP